MNTIKLLHRNCLQKGIVRLTFFLLLMQGKTQAQKFVDAPFDPNANYHQIVAQERLKNSQKKDSLINLGLNPDNVGQFVEENAQFERWAYYWKHRVNQAGKFPKATQGWENAMTSNPELFNSNILGPLTNRPTALTWTSLGPIDSSVQTDYTNGAGIGRINVVKRHPTDPSVFFAGATAGGLFKSTDLCATWNPISDNLAGLGVSDLAIDPTNPLVMYLATGDYDGAHMNSIGIFKSTDGGNTWAVSHNFDLSQGELIGHLLIDPADNNTIFATTQRGILKTTNGGTNWNLTFDAGENRRFNDFIKVGTNYFASDRNGNFYKSTDGTTFTLQFNVAAERLDLAVSAAAPDIIYFLKQNNPAFSKYTITTNTNSAFSNVTNTTSPTDSEAEFKTQSGYNQTIAVNPANANEIWVGEYSGKRSTDGGATWTCMLNGYFNPASATSNWGTFYVHSDHHFMEYLSADSMINGNDGGVYIANITTNNWRQRFNGLVVTQSYSFNIHDANPENLIISNQDNDANSRALNSGVYKYHMAQAGDGVTSAIDQSNPDLRYSSGQNAGSILYRTDAFTTSSTGNTVSNLPTGAPFHWDMQLHRSNSTIMYGGFGELYKRVDPTNNATAWVNLNTGAGQIENMAFSDNDNTKQKIIVIGSNGTVRKSADETTWSTITPPTGVTFNSIYAQKSNWDTLYATASGYDNANKVFFSKDNGVTWQNITDNLPNIQMKKIIKYEGSDTIFIGTELGVYFARVAPPLTTAPAGTAWQKYSTGLPNVIVTDLEISYTKKQLFVCTFGRGVWMVDLQNTVIPVNDINFTYRNTNTPGRYDLSWKINAEDVRKTILERSTTGSGFTALSEFSDSRKKLMNAFPVDLVNDIEYYRLRYLNSPGKTYYSNIIRLNKKGSSGGSISVYPNPTSNYINVNSIFKIKTVQIYFASGAQAAYAAPNNNFYTFDMSFLPVGTYIIKVLDEKGNISSEKVIRD